MIPQHRKLVKFGIAATILLFGLVFAYQIWDRQQMIRITLEWGRLAPFPKSAKQFTIKTEGSMFTRAFRASFVAPLGDIDHWLRASPGTRKVAPDQPSPSLRRFLISPGGGAAHAEVTVDDNSGLVTIYVYWS